MSIPKDEPIFSPKSLDAAKLPISSTPIISLGLTA
jgi:hypothetical protein